MMPTKPYLLRAIHEWAEDNQLTPQVLIDTEIQGVDVPRSHVVDGQIVLNVGSSAVELHQMDNECLSFSASFGGQQRSIYLPMNSILAIFARENSQGIYFDEATSPNGDKPTDGIRVIPSEQKDNKKDSVLNSNDKKRDASHLKIIK